jgi:peroxiredoxin
MLQKKTILNIYATPDKEISLADMKRKNVNFAFYPADWSPVCSDQMALYNETLKILGKQALKYLVYQMKMVSSGFTESVITL